jgi:hypothetical protein
VIGQPGTGKSRALESWILQDILAGRGVGVIDPHGDLFEHILLRVAQMAHRQPQIAERVVVINPCDPQWAVGFNPLQAVAGMPVERLAWFLTDVVLKIWKMDSAGAPRMVWLLVNAFLALSDLGLTLVDLPRFLRDQVWRESLVPRLANPQAQGYFLLDFPRTPGAINQWVQPVINKIGAFTFDPDIKAIVGQKRSTISFREILDRQLTVLVNLPKGVLGEENSRLLAAFLVSQFQKAALSRADIRKREPFYLYLDEFQNYTTDNIEDVLSESRKYALSLVMAHQYLDQLSGDLRKAVLNTAGTIVSFRVGYHDALELAREMFPTPLSVSHQELRFISLGRCPFPYFEEKQERKTIGEVAALLTRLAPRQFWVKRRGVLWPTRQKSLFVPDPPLTPQVREAAARLLAVSGRRYGRPKEEVVRELAEPHRHLLMAPVMQDEGAPSYYD